jgi:hypothetical protein
MTLQEHLSKSLDFEVSETFDPDKKESFDLIPDRAVKNSEIWNLVHSHYDAIIPMHYDPKDPRFSFITPEVEIHFWNKCIDGDGPAKGIIVTVSTL